MSKRNRIPGVYAYTIRRGKRWAFIAQQPNDPVTGKRRQIRKRGYLTQEAAHAAQRAILYGEGVSESLDAKTSLSVYLDDWLASLVEIAPGTRRAYRNHLIWIKTAIGTVPLSELKAPILERVYADRIRTGVKTVTVHDANRVLSQALRRAVLHDLIRSNPCDRARVPKPDKHLPNTWSQEEMRTFLKIHSEDLLWGDYWSTLCQTWLRLGEINDLRWQDIDVDRRVITISHAVFRDEQLKPVSGTVKTLKSNRRIVISAALAERLKTRRQSMKAPATSLVFPSPRPNGWLTSQAVGRALKRSCESAGVPVLTPHEIRHSGATIAIRNRTSPKVVSEKLGHASVRFTLEVYSHPSEADQELLAEMFDDILTADDERDGVNFRLVNRKPA